MALWSRKKDGSDSPPPPVGIETAASPVRQPAATPTPAPAQSAPVQAPAQAPAQVQASAGGATEPPLTLRKRKSGPPYQSTYCCRSARSSVF